MTSESPPASRNVQALRDFFVEKNVPVMGVGIPHPRQSRRDSQGTSPPRNITPIKIPRPVIAPKPYAPGEKTWSHVPSDVNRDSPAAEKGTQNSQPSFASSIISERVSVRVLPRVGTPKKIETTSSPTKSPSSSPTLPPKSNGTKQDSVPKLPPPRPNTPKKLGSHVESATRQSDSKSPVSSISDSDSSRHSSPALTTSSSRRQPEPADSREDVQNSANINLKQSIQAVVNSEKRGGECLVTTPDNYVCNSGIQRLVWRRRQLPSLKELGPPPAKPPRPGNLLPHGQQQVESIQPPPRAKRSNQHSDTKCNVPPQLPTTVPPLLPARSPAQAPLHLSHKDVSHEEEELYVDTDIPDESSSPIPEYTEDEEYQLYADTEITASPPAVPDSKRPDFTALTGSTDELYQDSTLCEEEMYEEMPCPEVIRSPSPTYAERKEERALKKEREKREAAARKAQRKFGMTGLEEPLDTGRVKCSSRGGRLDLSVKKGDTLYILRMENNPPGKWLVRNEKGEVGYAELTNIEVMISRVQPIGNLSKDITGSAPEEDEEEAIYEETI